MKLLVHFIKVIRKFGILVKLVTKCENTLNVTLHVLHSNWEFLIEQFASI
jgi:hypothetical protein